MNFAKNVEGFDLGALEQFWALNCNWFYVANDLAT